MSRKAELFARALEQPLVRREAFVRRATPNDPDLGDEVLSLLRAYGGLGRFLEADEGSSDGPANGAEPGPTSVPGHELVRKLGEGGFGIVYLAREIGSLPRPVAVKFLKLERLSSTALASFDAERQILAGLEHDGIARVFTAGTTEAGCPYYTMEWVDGPPIDDYCDARRLSVEQRVALLPAVCRAVAHAHQRGIIHGDLKPRNILVRPGEGACSAQPKVIDFGIARMLGETPSGRPATAGTPRYMSPEQRAGHAPDTRCDVFALGVLLHDVLLGRPSDGTSLTAQRTLRLIDARPDHELAASRRSSPWRMRRALDGDLDRIVRRATRTDPEQRYPTVRELLLDLEAWLARRPLPSRPRTVPYVALRFLQRHWLASALLGLAATTATGFGLHNERLDRRARASRDAAQTASERARELDIAAGEALGFLVQVLWSAAPENHGREITLGEVVDAAHEAFLESPPRAPLVEAQLALTLGRLAERVGRLEQARGLVRRSLAILDTAPYPGRRAQARLHLAHLLAPVGHELERRVLLERARAEFGADDREAQLVVEGELALLSRDEGDAAGSIRAIRALHERAIDELGPSARLTLRFGLQRAALEVVLGEADALARLQDLVDGAASDPEFAGFHANLRARIILAQARCEAGELDAARALAQGVLDGLGQRGIEAEELSAGVEAIRVLGTVASRERDHEAALGWFERAHDAQLQRAGPDSRTARRAAATVAATLLNLDRLDDARHWLEEHGGAPPTDEPAEALDTLDIELLRVHAQVLRRAGDEFAALACQERIVAACERCYGPDRPQALDARQHHAMTLARLDRHADALRELDRAQAGWAATRGATDPNTLAAIGLRARVLSFSGRVDEASELLQTRLRTALAAHGPEHGAVTAALFDLGGLADRFDRKDMFFASCAAVTEAFESALRERPDDDRLQEAFEAHLRRVPPRGREGR